MALSPEQLGSLRAAKLRSIVTTRSGPGDRSGGSFPRGAGLVDGSTAWVLIDELGPRALGGALAWAQRAGARRLELVLSNPDPTVAGGVARRAGQCARPVAVTYEDGGVVAAAPLPAVLDGPTGVGSLIEVIRATGCEVVLECGIIRGEWLGLEVCRIVGESLEVGIGRYDREIALLTYASLPAAEALAKVISQIVDHRRAGAAFHPMRQLGRERWLRRHLLEGAGLADSATFGATELAPIESTVARDNLRDDHPAFALGVGADGAPVLLAATVGADLDLIPLAMDTRAARAPGAALVVVHPVDVPLPAAVVAVADWYDIEPRVLAVAAPWGAPESTPPAAL